jgi:hypothetical protein
VIWPEACTAAGLSTSFCGPWQGLNMRDSGCNISYALRKSAIDQKRQSFVNASQNGFKARLLGFLRPPAAAHSTTGTFGHIRLDAPGSIAFDAHPTATWLAMHSIMCKSHPAGLATDGISHLATSGRDPHKRSRRGRWARTRS